MSITSDMDTALTVVARVRAELAMYPSWTAAANQLRIALTALEDCLMRVRQIEGGPVAEHWKQRAVTDSDLAAGVVSLAAEKQRRAVARVVRL